MKSRYEGSNRPQLIEALKRQEMISGNAELANVLASVGELQDRDVGNIVITQGADDNDIYFIIAGAFAIVVHGSQVATRKAGTTIGEMSAIEPALSRSATVSAVEKSVTLKLTCADFMKIAEQFPQVWTPIAKELARRLYERNKTIQPPNEQPKLFIMSSSEALEIAKAIEAGLKPDVWTKRWDDGVFFAGGYPLEVLERQVAESDFAVAVAEPDDIIETRGKKQPTVRDNVLFELGLFMGKLTRYRTILVHPKVNDLKLPSDLYGLTLVQYEEGELSTVHDRVKPACAKIREVVQRLGVWRAEFD